MYYVSLVMNRIFSGKFVEILLDYKSHINYCRSLSTEISYFRESFDLLLGRLYYGDNTGVSFILTSWQ